MDPVSFATRALEELAKGDDYVRSCIYMYMYIVCIIRESVDSLCRDGTDVRAS